MQTRRSPRTSKGMTLILVAGVLAVLAALSTGFYAIALMQTKSATRYADSVRAEMMVRAGVEDGVARLRELTFRKTEDPTDPWYGVDFLNGARRRVAFACDLSTNNIDDDGDGVKDNIEEREMPFTGSLGNSASTNSDRYLLHVSDAASKINVNAGDNLAVTLDNLCRVIGPPLTCADINALQPRVWCSPICGGDPALFDPPANPAGSYTIPAWAKDTAENRDIYYARITGTERPLVNKKDEPVYGDGYAIAGFRARHGRFLNINDVKNALTYVDRDGDGKADHPLEQLEIEVKFAALRDYITTDSWVDTNTVCVGKFEWVTVDTAGGGKTICIDRDKSWVSSVDDKGTPIFDPLNNRGSLVGSYVSIMNGHGAGQLRRIKSNGIDWIEVENGFEVLPGPISSYVIMAKEDAKLETLSGVTPTTTVPMMNSDGTLVDDPNIDYALRPLCIHRAPVNINTASDKVLEALFMGINVQHGHPMAIGTDADIQKLRELKADGTYADPPPAGGWTGTTLWKVGDFPNRAQEPYLLTIKGLKRVPPDSGRLILDCREPWTSASKTNFDPAGDTEDARFGYLINNNTLGAPSFLVGGGVANEAHELAFRVITARQRKIDPATGKPVVGADPDPLTTYEKGPFKSWDDFYFRVVKPWDDDRLDPAKNPNAAKKMSVARMIMAHFNSNTDLLKFNPNIEWIDRWGRNFTELEPVLIYNDGVSGRPATMDPVFLPGAADAMWAGYPFDNGKQKGAYYARTYRYKSEDLIDKSDMNRSTTEFCFDSGGIFEVQSTGQVMRRGEVLAERKAEVLVKLYDVWRESTQKQFVQGSIHCGTHAPANERGTTYAGQVTRHAGVKVPNELSPLVTWPEPLVPLDYKIDKSNVPNPSASWSLRDDVSGTQYDAYGQTKQPGVPDVIANRVQPAQWDGQIALATNTTKWDTGGNDMNTFLASFNGDLDTETANCSGREQAKTPRNKKIRVLDTISLLGLLNDKEVDFDPDAYDVFATNKANGGVYLPLDKDSYWHNVTCRMGDLRPEGVFLGNVGTSGKDATIKYRMMDGAGGDAVRNYDPGNETGGNGHTVCMWFKPSWHGDDHIEHEFFNATNKGNLFGARYNNLVKYGKYSWACPEPSIAGRGGTGGGEHQSDNCLCYCIENSNDADWKAYLHGGTFRVTPYPTRESPSFHIQPFRWGFVGGRAQPNNTIQTVGRGGWWTGNTLAADGITNGIRPFIDSQRDPEGPSFNARYYWAQLDIACQGTSFDLGEANHQEAAWSAAPIKADGGTSKKGVFGANNLNQDVNNWLYRSTPLDGTLAVIDEMKISKNAWSTQRLHDEMTLSRYYLPPDPSDKLMCPLFISQTMLQSIRGFDKKNGDEMVTLARLSWTVFTPRFMWESKKPMRQRFEKIMRAKAQANFRGPFDYIQYNMDVLPSDGEAGLNAPVAALGVDRPTPVDYGGQSHASKGVEIELIDSKTPDPAAPALANKTFTNPDAFNPIGDPATPIKVKTSQLRYRVRFRYPMDSLVANHYGINQADVTPNDYYLLDTPVFDDISITYFTKPKYLSYRQITE
jgi:hypothetical protein